VVTLEGRRMSVMAEGLFYLMLRLSDKRSCAVSYSSHRTPWLSRADGGSVIQH